MTANADKVIDTGKGEARRTTRPAGLSFAIVAPFYPDAYLFAMMPESTSPVFPAHRFSIAPMLDWTDRHCRYFLRLLSRHTLLYTEMVTTGRLFMAGDYGV
jgi:tRNA-dihydrouridine synthase A